MGVSVGIGMSIRMGMSGLLWTGLKGLIYFDTPINKNNFNYNNNKKSYFDLFYCIANTIPIKYKMSPISSKAESD